MLSRIVQLKHISSGVSLIPDIYFDNEKQFLSLKHVFITIYKTKNISVKHVYNLGQKLPDNS